MFIQADQIPIIANYQLGLVNQTSYHLLVMHLTSEYSSNGIVQLDLLQVGVIFILCRLVIRLELIDLLLQVI
ncbi:hypothetical protein D3C76_1807100 [compost metagenome]